jgi:hypothetical protein
MGKLMLALMITFAADVGRQTYAQTLELKEVVLNSTEDLACMRDQNILHRFYTHTHCNNVSVVVWLVFAASEINGFVAVFYLPSFLCADKAGFYRSHVRVF